MSGYPPIHFDKHTWFYDLPGRLEIIQQQPGGTVMVVLKKSWFRTLHRRAQPTPRRKAP